MNAWHFAHHLQQHTSQAASHTIFCTTAMLQEGIQGVLVPHQCMLYRQQGTTLAPFACSVPG